MTFLEIVEKNIGNLITIALIIITQVKKPFKRLDAVEEEKKKLTTKVADLEKWQTEVKEVLKEVLEWKIGREEAIKTYYKQKEKDDTRLEKFIDAVNELGQKVYALMHNKQ